MAAYSGELTEMQEFVTADLTGCRRKKNTSEKDDETRENDLLHCQDISGVCFLGFWMPRGALAIRADPNRTFLIKIH